MKLAAVAALAVLATLVVIPAAQADSYELAQVRAMNDAMFNIEVSPPSGYTECKGHGTKLLACRLKYNTAFTTAYTRFVKHASAGISSGNTIVIGSCGGWLRKFDTVGNRYIAANHAVVAHPTSNPVWAAWVAATNKVQPAALHVAADCG